jgi:diguanylate cyclase (GGDEF)-like protein
MVKRKVDKINLLFFILIIVGLFIFLKVDIIIYLLILIIFIIFLQSINLIYKNKKYKKMYNLAEFYKRRYNMAIEALEGSKDIVYWWNINESVISIGNGIRKYLDIVGKGDIIIPISTWHNYIMKDDLGKYKSKMEEVINSNKSEYYSIEYRILGKHNKVYWVECKGKKTIEKNGYVFIHGALSNITNRKEKELEINYLTFNDEVTGIPNRRYFVREVNKRITNNPNHKMALIFIDLDNFKYINDTYGHDSGDELLCEFSKIVCNMNIEDSFFVRYGGDEFILVKYGACEKKQVSDLLDNIIKKLSKPIIVNNKEIFISLSIGVSIYPIDGREVGMLLKRADMAMYLAKINGKNRYEFFNLKILEVLNREFNIEKGLRIAIDNEEIKLVYQPKVMIKTGEVIGFEVLSRWQSKEFGLVSPSEFIPIAENSGLIISIGEYIIDESFKKCKELAVTTSKKFKFSINLSEVQIRDEVIVCFIGEALKRYDLDPDYIEFEITENIIMKSAEKNIETLKKIKSLGISLALDDFGTGYSSLSYLRTLPIDVLKIDKSFIDGILIEEKSEYITNTIIDLSHFLNLLVVAEGVETKEQFEYLKNSNCDIIQGYYFSKPVDFKEARKMIID